jgi:RNA polymerase sigma factor (TIGR02999 family)
MSPDAAGSTDGPMDAGHDVTDLLVAWRKGDQEALARLIPLVHDELRRIAHAYLARERPGHTLRTTALVNEAYLRLVNTSHVQWQHRAQFFAAAAGSMRRILVDYARRYHAGKRGGGLESLPLDEGAIAVEQRADMLIALDEALERLGALDARLCRVVECRYFAGLTDEETAEALGVTSRTVRRDWVKARGWLYAELQG